MKLQSAAIARSTNLLKISLWIRNLGSISAVTRVIEPIRDWAKTIFKIRQSVGLFTFLLMRSSNVNTANRNLSWTGAYQLGIFQESVSAGLNLDFFNQEQIKQVVMAGLELRTLRLQD